MGETFHKISHKQALKLATAQYAEAKVALRANQQQHQSEFSKMWVDLSKKWAAGLNDSEREKFSLLKTECERDAFRIIRNFAWMARERNQADFPVALYNLADRLGITPPGAAKLLGRFAESGILSRTAYAVIYQSAARYRWLFRSGFAQSEEVHDAFNYEK